jgi:phage shock protein C
VSRRERRSERRAGVHPARNRLYRDRERGILAGVCAGIADYFDLPTILVRTGVVLGLFFFTFPTIAGYLILALVLRPRPPELFESEEDEAFWRRVRAEPKRTAADLERRFRDLERRLRDAEAHVTSRAFDLDRRMRDL